MGIYIYKLFTNNIDSINISIFVGIMTGWFVVILENEFSNIKNAHKGFIDDKYRRCQRARLIIVAISRFKEIYYITESFDADNEKTKTLLRTLALEDLKKEIDEEIEIVKPYYYFKEKYITEGMLKIIDKEQSCFKELKDLINNRQSDHIDICGLLEVKANLWQVAFEMRKEPRRKIKHEIILTVLKNKSIIGILIVALLSMIIG